MSDFELKDEHYETTQHIGAGFPDGCWVFEVTENADLYSYYFGSYDEAKEYVESTENKCQILCTRYDGMGAYKITVEDLT